MTTWRPVATAVTATILMCSAGFTALTSTSAHAQDAASTATPTRNDYSKPETWLCRPGGTDACSVDLTTTVVAANGTLSRETFTPNTSAPIDCFYVYPTVSRDPWGNSDMNPDREEKRVILLQFARFAAQCRVYAPMYRQVTMTALRAYMAGKPIPADEKLAYNDVLDAWKYYLEHDNKGRGFVLIGHSQGSGILTRLVHEEIDGKPIQAKLVSAILSGTNLKVPKGKDVGGDFAHIPLCHAATQIHCAIAYASFRSTIPPPADSFFGKTGDEKTVAACTNPAALGGGSGDLHSYFASAGTGNPAATHPFQWVTPDTKIETPFVSTPGLVSARCTANEHGAYLEITVHGDPTDPRTDDISGDIVVGEKVEPRWGLHGIDINLAMGNLIDIVGQQAKVYEAKARR